MKQASQAAVSSILEVPYPGKSFSRCRYNLTPSIVCHHVSSLAGAVCQSAVRARLADLDTKFDPGPSAIHR